MFCRRHLPIKSCNFTLLKQMKLILKIGAYWILAEALLLVLAFCLMWNGDSLESAMRYIKVVTVDLISGWKFHTTGALCSGLIWLFVYFKKIYQSKGLKIMSRKIAIYLLFPFAILISSFKVLDWYKYSDHFEWVEDKSVFNSTGKVANRFAIDGKIRGMHVFGRLKEMD